MPSDTALTATKGNVADALARQPFARALRQVGRVAARAGIETYLVGGAVRDALLGRTTTDLDFVTVGDGTGIALAEALAEELGGTTAHVYENFGTAAVRVPSPVEHSAEGEDEPMVLEFVAARSESYRSASRKPEVEAATLADDLRRRDFTVNALAADVHPERFGALVDPFDGRADLERQLLRTPLEPEATFEDDPLRMVRAARFAAQLGFDVAPAARQAMQGKAERVEILAKERVAEELQKIIAADVPSIGFRILEDAGLLAHFLPELSALKGTERRQGESHKDNFLHTLQVLDQLVERVADRPADATRWLRWAALLHDIGKAETKRFQGGNWTFHGHEHVGARMVEDVFRRLKLPLGAPMRYARKLVMMHHRPADLDSGEVTDSAVRRLVFDAGADLAGLMALARADVTSSSDYRRRQHQAAYDRVEEKMRVVEEKDRLANFEPPLSGDEIMEALGIEEGVAVGIVKENIREAILDGEIPNEHAAARERMGEIAGEALRRGALFEEMQRRLEGPEQRALGAVKEVLFFGEVPPGRKAALERLLEVKDEALAEGEERG